MMGAALLVCRVGLAAVLSVAGAGKLLDRRGAREAVVDFGAPRALAGPLVVVVALLELAAAGLLLVPDTAAWGAVAAVGLLAVFSAAIGLALARGETPDCHCFGTLHSEPAGARALVRNGLLAAVAAFVVAGAWSDPGPSAIGWIGALDGTGLAVAVGATALLSAVAVLAWALLQAMRAHGRVLARLERVEIALAAAGVSLDDAEPDMPAIGHAPGTAAPDFSLRDTLGVPVTRDSLLEPGRPLLLLFTSPTCGPCAALMPTVMAWQREHEDVLTVVLVSGGEPEAVRTEARRHGLERVLVDEAFVVSRAYEANGTPSAVLVSPGSEISSWVASGPDWIERLVDDAVAHAAADTVPAGLPVGTVAPPLALSDPAGGRVELAELRGSEITLLFWNPGCGHCRAMHADLLAWEAGRPAGSTGLVVVSTGDPEATAAEGFRSRVLFDDHFEVGPAFAAVGTPMAVRLDAEGRVAAPLAAGAGAVFALADTSSPDRHLAVTTHQGARNG